MIFCGLFCLFGHLYVLFSRQLLQFCLCYQALRLSLLCRSWFIFWLNYLLSSSCIFCLLLFLTFFIHVLWLFSNRLFQTYHRFFFVLVLLRKLTLPLSNDRQLLELSHPSYLIFLLLLLEVSFKRNDFLIYWFIHVLCNWFTLGLLINLLFLLPVFFVRCRVISTPNNTLRTHCLNLFAGWLRLFADVISSLLLDLINQFELILEWEPFWFGVVTIIVIGWGAETAVVITE